jgi:hypothetical protein
MAALSTLATVSASVILKEEAVVILSTYDSMSAALSLTTESTLGTKQTPAKKSIASYTS